MNEHRFGHNNKMGRYMEFNPDINELDDIFLSNLKGGDGYLNIMKDAPMRKLN